MPSRKASAVTCGGPLCISALNKAGLRPDQDLAAVYEGRFQDVMAQQRSMGSLDAICPGPGAWRIMNEQEPGKQAFGSSCKRPRIGAVFLPGIPLRAPLLPFRVPPQHTPGRQPGQIPCLGVTHRA